MTAPDASDRFRPVTVFNLKNQPDFSEARIQQYLYDHPEILGLGPSVESRDKERVQPAGGRLDLLMVDIEKNIRYEIEVQLGATDESHIIRTLEYWDVERKRFPDYKHVAVIVAEEITARFFNVITLFNQAIPLIAYKMTAIRNLDDSVGLLFTRVLDVVQKVPDEDEKIVETTDRAYWEKKSSRKDLTWCDNIIQVIRTNPTTADANFSYNKFYLGIWLNDKPNNFVIIRPRKSYFYLDIKLPQTDDLDSKIQESVFEEVTYTNEGRYRLRIDSSNLKDGQSLIEELLRLAASS